ncbi:MAG: DinB family protein [Acidobacteriaceae bacterium]|nr:DinB family protein [Acidobacteriaceae bacterium]
MSSPAANPYRAMLNGRDYREVIAETPERLTDLVEKIGPSGMERSYAEGKWSASQILAHLADCEIAFAFRLRQALAESHHLIQPFNQEAWASIYPGMNVSHALDVFRVVRAWNLAFVGALRADAFAKPVSHPERGAMTLQTILETIAGHDLNHLGQLETIAAQG